MKGNFIISLRDYCGLKISDFILEYTDTKINFLSTHSSNLSKKGLFIRVLSFIKKAIFNSSFYHPVISENTILVACNSVNEYEASYFLKEQEDLETAFIGTHPNNHNFKAYLLGLLLLPLVLAKALKEGNEIVNRSLPHILDQLMISSGLYFIYQNLFRNNIKALVISNHLSPETRVAMHLAKKNNINIIYLQHSQLVSIYPSIEADYYLLSGKDSLRKLKNINKTIDEKKIYLLGSPKLDNFQIKEKKSVEQISICINPGAELVKVRELALYLNKSFTSSVISIRPHPGIRKEFLKHYKNLELEGFLLILPNEESLVKFLERSDIIISEDSGIYYEAGYVGNISLSYKMSDQSKDWYDLKGVGGHNIFDSPLKLVTEITRILKNQEDTRSNFKIFYENIDTNYDGRSENLYIDTLSSIDLKS